ncbi:MAG TPA: site-2 protease family protein [Thermoanaerobaculia bacterium]|jgi:Zn-dependent protease
MSTPERLTCRQCGTQIAPALLSCPACGWLVHGDELKRLAQEAEAAAAASRWVDALGAWRRVHELVPAGSRQFHAVAARIEVLGRKVDAGEDEAAERKRPAWLGRGGAIAAAGLLLWKLKAVLGFVLTKGKVLLLGLGKGGTMISMLLSAGLYWTIWGWKFAFGLVLAIYVHEMGHVAALRHYGIRASAPMFIPGLGAVIRLKQYPANPREDARVGLAGPLWGLGSVIGFYAVYLATGWTSLAAIARFSAWINLFNLLPVWQLDGGRAFRALGRAERWMVALTMGVMWFLTGEGLLVLLALAAGVRAAVGQAAETSDRVSFLQFVGLVVALSLLTLIEVPGLPGTP